MATVLVGFLVSNSQAATQHLVLPQAKYRAYPAGSEAYNSGPLCIAASERDHGLVSPLLQAQRSLLPGREGVAFVRRDNVASRAVRTKYDFREVAAEFSHGWSIPRVLHANSMAYQKVWASESSLIFNTFQNDRPNFF